MIGAQRIFSMKTDLVEDLLTRHEFTGLEPLDVSTPPGQDPVYAIKARYNPALDFKALELKVRHLLWDVAQLMGEGVCVLDAPYGHNYITVHVRG